MKPYVKQSLTERQRSLCAQLRLGTLPSVIQTCRFTGLPEEKRLCLLCNLGEIEAEAHFILYHPLYSDLRTALF